MKKIVDLRSDTITKPTNEMLEAMQDAIVGDDVYGEDPTVNQLELLSAEKMGKEEAMFVASGTMGNLCALMSHTHPGEEFILEADAHIYYYEVAGFATIAGLSPRLVPGENGIMSIEKIKTVLRHENIHFPPTTLLCIENSHNRGGGTVYPVQLMDEIAEFAHGQGLKVHVDGARIFNAAIVLGVEVKELVKKADSVMFCLSKGLSAPVGSVLVGNHSFIERARKVRKMLGGGMRQAGVLAAAGIVAIKNMVNRLSEDHANAREIAEGLSRIPGININLNTVQTNIVNVNFSKLGINTSEAVQKLAKKGIKVNGRPPYSIRMVTNRHVHSIDVDCIIRSVTEIAS